MRTLLLFRGAPGCGKSTFIEKHGLKPYTLSADDIRLLYGSPRLTPDGRQVISGKSDGAVWENIFKILEHRMINGEFTVIDACNSKSSEIGRYRTLAHKYRYRIFIVDLTDIPLEQCLKQNHQRPEFKWVPDEAIENIYSRFETQTVPSGIKVIKPDELDTILDKPIDLSEYKKIVHIGDIHGCFDTLNKYFESNPISNDTCYIFTGDYLDRGDQNLKTIQFLDSIKDLPNVCLLEGNHEVHLSKYGNGENANSKEFNFKTKPVLQEGNFTEKMARAFYRKIRQFSHYTYNGLEVLACHGGIPNLNTNLLYLQTDLLIHGSGKYEDYEIVAESWMKDTKPNQYLIHGHRNTAGTETQIADRVFNLEGSIEFGGKLRIVELTKEDGFKVVEIDNCQPEKPLKRKIEKGIISIKDAIEVLRSNPLINEKKLSNNISSFNFSRNAFLKKSWDVQTILARGLFINTATNEIAARSYEKFFNLGEMQSTQPATLKMNLKFPLKAYLKENGFLGMISWDTASDEIFISSKSVNHGEYVDYLKKILFEKYDMSKISMFLKNNPGVTLIVEVIDIENDPHIIKYDSSKLVLLDIVYNTIEFKKFKYKELTIAGSQIGIEVKKLAMEIESFEEFRDVYMSMEDNDYKFNNEYIEGFVFEDDSGFMFKVKTGYYKEWKGLRQVAQSTFRNGMYLKTSSLTTPLQNKFYYFCKKQYEKGEKYTNIVKLRDEFFNAGGLHLNG